MAPTNRGAPRAPRGLPGGGAYRAHPPGGGAPTWWGGPPPGPPPHKGGWHRAGWVAPTTMAGTGTGWVAPVRRLDRSAVAGSVVNESRSTPPIAEGTNRRSDGPKAQTDSQPGGRRAQLWRPDRKSSLTAAIETLSLSGVRDHRLNPRPLKFPGLRWVGVGF